MSATPAFAVTPRIGYARATVAMNNARDGSSATGLVAIIQGGTSGTRVDRVLIVNLEPAGTATVQEPQVYRLYLYDGTNYRLVHEVASAATITDPTTAIAGYLQTVTFSPALVLPSNTWYLYGGISKQSAASDYHDFIAFGADL